MSQSQNADSALAKLRGMTLAEIEALIPAEGAESSRPFLDPAKERDLQEGIARIKKGALPIILLQQDKLEKSRPRSMAVVPDGKNGGSLLKNHRNKLILTFFVLGTSCIFIIMNPSEGFSRAQLLVFVIALLVAFMVFMLRGEIRS